MNLSLNDLSYWERKLVLDFNDFIVVGAGIVGISCACHLKKKHPKAKIIILDKGILPFAATSKNAGFACFGSPSEIVSDLQTTDSSKVWETVDKRWRGLKALEEWLGIKNIDLQVNGSWDLLDDDHNIDAIRSSLIQLNAEMEKITGEKMVYSEDKAAVNHFGFQNVKTTFKNKLEGQIDTAKLNNMLVKKAVELDIQILRGVEVLHFDTDKDSVILKTNLGEISGSNLILCTNGFTKSLIKEIDVVPARAQVMITKPINNLKLKGTFHYDDGFYYFRNIDNRILIGGGRNHNFEQETTTEVNTTEDIQHVIEGVLKNIVLPTTHYEIDYRWSGIMGVGANKSPIVQRLNNRVCLGVRMGGMGVAIGTLIGKELAEMHS